MLNLLLYSHFEQRPRALDKKGYLMIIENNFSYFSLKPYVVIPPLNCLEMPVQRSGWPGRVAQSVGHLTRKSAVLGSIPGLATYFRFSFRFFKKGSCQLLAKVCARSTG